MPLEDIIQQIHKAEQTAGREKGSVQLVAVSKMQPDERVEAVLEEGHRVFGENRVQEAAGKWPGFRERFDGVELHLLGPLQSNKARQAMELFDVIHSVDRPKIARTIARLAEELGQCPKLFLQVNTGEEPQKAGVMPAEVDGFVAKPVGGKRLVIGAVESVGRLPSCISSADARAGVCDLEVLPVATVEHEAVVVESEFAFGSPLGLAVAVEVPLAREAGGVAV